MPFPVSITEILSAGEQQRKIVLQTEHAIIKISKAYRGRESTCKEQGAAGPDHLTVGEKGNPILPS